MKYLCEFKEFMIMERSKEEILAAMDNHNRLLKKYNVKTHWWKDPYGFKGVKAARQAEYEAAKAKAEANSKRFNNLQNQPKKQIPQQPMQRPRPLPQQAEGIPMPPRPRSLPQQQMPQQPRPIAPQPQQMVKPALNVQQKPFYRRFF